MPVRLELQPCFFQEVKRLEDSGVDIIVALGHSGYETDLEVAR